MEILIPDPVSVPKHGFKNAVPITKAAVVCRCDWCLRIDKRTVKIDELVQNLLVGSEGKGFRYFIYFLPLFKPTKSLTNGTNL